VLKLRRDLASGKFRRAGGSADAASVQIVLEDGSDYPQRARLLFSDLSVDPTSGQITLRAEVPNPSGLLLPGMYVRVRLEQAETPTGIVVPQQAVQRGSTGDSVMVVGNDGKVAPRPVKVGTAQGGQWVILEGLTPGEMVMVDGFQKLRGNAPVKPVPWQPASSAPAASAPGAGAAPAPASAASVSR
jgi:membrane fusion protein (multidrug efflux system)